MAAAFPYNVSGWVSRETGSLIDDAIKRGPSKAKLVRMALDSYMKRYGKPSKGPWAELHIGLDNALDRDPALAAKIDALIYGGAKPANAKARK